MGDPRITYPDTFAGAQKAFHDLYDVPMGDPPKPELIPDPRIRGCWLAIDHERELAALLYIGTHELATDTEETDYEESLRKYSKRKKP